jgi:hypothetical protein
MKFRDSLGATDNKLIFVLYGPEWELRIDLEVPKNKEDFAFDFTCTGIVKPEDKEHAFVWAHSCAEVVLNRLDFEDPEGVYEIFKRALQEGFHGQDS